MMKTKAKTEFVLNILIFADFSNGWNQLILQDLIDCIEEISQNDHEQNRIVLSYNPILTICLSCIHLQSIGKSISYFKHRSHTISMSLLDLGIEIIASIDSGD